MSQISILAVLLAGTAVGALLALWAALSRKGKTEDEARAYLAGFTYVLSDDPDGAIAELSKAAQLNTQTVEAYFALGALFRRKGENERAIRLHTNMLLRSGLGPEVRRRALLAVATDYRRAALRDKAAETFQRLLAEDPDNREALGRFRQVLEEAGDWAGAVKVQERVVALDRQGQDVLAHLLAGQARSALGDMPADALGLAERAVLLAPDSADAQLVLAEARLKLGQHALAAPPLKRALELEPELAPRVMPSLTQAFSPPDLEAFLVQQITARGAHGAPFELALALFDRSRGQVDRAISALRRLVDRHPRFWEARKELGALLLAQDRSEELRADYADILGTLGQAPTGFQCAACRQKLPDHVFRCPSCEAWDTVRPDR